MRKSAALVVALVVISAGVVVLRDRACTAWQDDYKRFLYTEMLKNSPVTYSPEDIDTIIGERPVRCERPASLTDEDVARYRKEKIGPNEFVDEMRKAARQASG